MRDYLYLWHDIRSRRLVASGVEFSDFVPELSGGGGVVLLRHGFLNTALDRVSGLSYVANDEMAELVADDIHGYGDFRWADFGRGVELAALTDDEVARLTFFAHMNRPLHGTAIPALGNRFLVSAHDDGWHTRIFYTHWGAIKPVLRQMLRGLLGEEQALNTLARLGHGMLAFWVQRDLVFECEQTEDIDLLQRQHLRGVGGP